MLVDGQEVDRVVGGTTYSRLEQMCKLTAATAPANPMAAMPGQMSAPSAPPGVSLPPTPSSNVPVAPAGMADQLTSPPASPPASPASGISDATLIAASVRLRVEDANGHSCGSGTIIDARDGEALILTCGHIFRDSKGEGQVEVDLFSPGGQQRVLGRRISHDAGPRDVGLVAIHVPGPVVMVRVAPPGYRIQPGMPVVSVGCNNGNPPSAQHSQITSLDKFAGPPTIQVAGQPVEGRSGGGLFSSDGYVIGVCNAADPADKEGLFAALGYDPCRIGSEECQGDQPRLRLQVGGREFRPLATDSSAALAANPLPAMPKQMPGPTDRAPLGDATPAVAETPAGLPSHEQAALDEVRRYKKEGKEVIFIVRSRDNPNAKARCLSSTTPRPSSSGSFPPMDGKKPRWKCRNRGKSCWNGRRKQRTGSSGQWSVASGRWPVVGGQ